MFDFLNIFKHLLPRARAWSINFGTQLRQFFEGLTIVGINFKEFIDVIWLDIFPQPTQFLNDWEVQFGLRDNPILTEQERRDRLDAAWKAQGGQDPRYIQDTLQANGFPVFLHEWWVPGSEPPVNVKQCVTPRNPLDYIRPSTAPETECVNCGEFFAQCGEPEALCGNCFEPIGYPLVNKVYTSVPNFIANCGEAIMECGEPEALCGNFLGYKEVQKIYIVPNDPSKWPYFLYIGGETFPETVNISPARKDEFEDLCLKICPNQLWLGILVSYT